MSRQYWEEGLSWATADGTAVTNTVTETILFPNVTIPANYLQDGRTLRIRASGQYQTMSGQPWVSFFLRWGGVSGTLMAKTSPTTLPSSVTGALWDLDAYLTTRSNGSSGTVLATGTARIFSGIQGSVASATGEAFVAPLSISGSSVIGTPTATVDLTADTALALSAQWGSANAANSIKGHNYVIEAIN